MVEGGNYDFAIFICRVTFPTVPCTLRIFEPRYRLMVRQCLQAGTNQFGVCTFLKGYECVS